MRWQSIGIVSLVALLGTTSLTAAQQQVDPYRAQTEVRLSRMENDIRRLTGANEEAMYRITQLNKQLEDAQYRIDALEKQLAQASAGQPQGAPGGAGMGEEGGPPPDSGPHPLPGMQQQDDMGGPPGSRPAANGRVADTLGGQLTSPGGTPAPAKGTPEETPDQYLQGDTPDAQFNYAFSLLRQDNYQGAEEAFRAFLAANPDHRAAPNAKYWLGKTYFAEKNYAQAARVLLDGYKQFADSDKGPDMVLTLGLSLHELNQNDQACATYDELNHRYPKATPAIKQKAKAAQQAAGCL